VFSTKHELLRHHAPSAGNLFDWKNVRSRLALVYRDQGESTEETLDYKIVPAQDLDDKAKGAISAIS